MYATESIARIADVPLPTVHYWARTGVIKPSEPGRRGRGGSARYGFRELVAILTLRELRGSGVSLQTMRKVVSELAKRGDDLASVRLVLFGKQVYVAVGEQDLMDVLTKQVAFRHLVVAMQPIEAEARKAVRKLRRAAA